MLYTTINLMQTNYVLKKDRLSSRIAAVAIEVLDMPKAIAT
jgi:hypothetical protein